MNIHNRIKLKGIRKRLRNNMTHAEVILWMHLKSQALDGFKFRRQHSVDKYVLDFYCPEASLAIEIDGITHAGKRAKLNDSEKDNHLRLRNIKVLRIIK
jgi:very-short-patch-repair endonuclease